MPILNKPIEVPNGYITPQALAFVTSTGELTTVDTMSPLPVLDSSFSGATPLVPGVARAAGRALMIVCLTAGQVSLVLAGSQEITVPVSEGLTILPFSVTKVGIPGTTASATFWSLS